MSSETMITRKRTATDSPLVMTMMTAAMTSTAASNIARLRSTA